MDSWYSEVTKYNFERGPGGATTGLLVFSQLKNQSSKEEGQHMILTHIMSKHLARCVPFESRCHTNKLYKLS